MNRDAVFLDLYRRLKETFKEGWDEIQAKLLYIYLQDLPPQCVPDAVLPLVYRPVYPPITIPREDVDRAVHVIAVELDRSRCMARRDVVDILRRAMPRYDEELIELLADVVARTLAEAGRAAVAGGRLCLAAETGIDVIREEPDALIVRFRCRDGKTRTYVISPLESEEEEEEGEETFGEEEL
jgi:hypothetical protein